MQRRERMIQAYAEEEARMRSSIPEMQVGIVAALIHSSGSHLRIHFVYLA